MERHKFTQPKFFQTIYPLAKYLKNRQNQIDGIPDKDSFCVHQDLGMDKTDSVINTSILSLKQIKEDENEQSNAKYAETSDKHRSHSQLHHNSK